MKPSIIFLIVCACALGIVMTKQFWHLSEEPLAVKSTPSLGIITSMKIPPLPDQTQLDRIRTPSPVDDTFLDVEDEAITGAPTEQQQELYHQILTNLLNPSYVQSVTIDEVLQEANQLTPAQYEQLIATAKTMIGRGELSLDNFKTVKFQRHKLQNEGAPLPSPKAQIHFEQILSKLQSPAYKKNLTFEKMTLDIKTLPPALKQEIADQVSKMLNEGQIDPVSFLGDEQYAGRSDIKLFFN